MKYFILSLVWTLCTSIGISQEETNITITNTFDGITVLNGIHLTLEKGEANTVKATGYRANEVIATVIEGNLQIQLTSRRKKKEQGITDVTLVYTDSIRSIELREGAKAHAEYAIDNIELSLVGYDASSFDINAECQRLNVLLSGKSKAQLAGETIIQKVETKGKSEYKALNLTCEQAIVKATGGSKIHIEVSQLVDAKATSSGAVIVYNKPKVVNQKASFGGTIILLEE